MHSIARTGPVARSGHKPSFGRSLTHEHRRVQATAAPGTRQETAFTIKVLPCHLVPNGHFGILDHSTTSFARRIALAGTTGAGNYSTIWTNNHSTRLNKWRRPQVNTRHYWQYSYKQLYIRWSLRDRFGKLIRSPRRKGAARRSSPVRLDTLAPISPAFLASESGAFFGLVFGERLESRLYWTPSFF